MTEISLFSGFKITNYYKYILYLAGVILILSLFVDAQEVDNNKLRIYSFWVIIGGLSIWFVKNILYKIDEYYEYQFENWRMTSYDFNNWQIDATITYYLFQIIVWFALFILYFLL